MMSPMIDFDGFTEQEQAVIFRWVARQAVRFDAACFADQMEDGQPSERTSAKPRRRTRSEMLDPFEMLLKGLPPVPRETTIAEDITELQRLAYRLRRGLTQLETKLLFS